jgi:PAS domain S-box-containing protein
MFDLPKRMSVRTRAAYVAVAVVIAMGIAYLDWITPKALALGPLEVVPVGFVAWLLPPAGAVVAALICGGVIALEEEARGYGAPDVLVNSFALTVAYLAVGALVAFFRRSSAALLEGSEAQYRTVGDAIPFGVWSADADGTIQYVSQSFLDLIGAKSLDDEALESLRVFVRGGRPFEFEREVSGTDGRRFTIFTRGTPVVEPGGAVRRFVGINLDITERTVVERSLQASEERYRVLTQSMPQIVWVLSPEGNIEWFNERWYTYSGMQRGEQLAGAFIMRVHPADRDRSFRTWISTPRRQTDVYEAQVRLKGGDGNYRWFLSRAAAQIDADGSIIKWLGTSTDIDVSKRAQEQLAFLARATESLTTTLDVDATCDLLARLAVPSIADWSAVFLREEDDSIRTAAIAHSDPVALARAWAMERRYPRGPDSVSPVAQAMRTGETVTAHFSDAAVRRSMTEGDATHERLLASLDFGAALYVPLQSGMRTIGVLALIDRDTQRAFDAADYDLASELARRAAVAIENARAFDRERRVADALQAAFLPPTLPNVPGLTFDAVYSPGAAESSIGGDWYDAFQLGDGRIVLSIGDVAGRGLRAAVVMGRVREAIRAFALQELKPAAILGAVERVLRLSKGETMVTALVAFVDPRAHTLTFANAGHPPPLLATGEGTVEALRLDGLPLGIFDDVEARTRTVALPDEAFLVFYTDGLIELERDVISGIAALRVAVERCYVARTRSAAAVYEAMTHDHAPDDDVAILTIAMQRLTNEPLQLEFPAVPESARLVRAALERFADSAQLDADRRFAIEVAVGEAVTNAIEHAYGIADGRVRIRALQHDGVLDVEVTDDGNWRAPREEGRGRGVQIMRALTKSLAIESTAAGTVVRMSFDTRVEASLPIT